MAANLFHLRLPNRLYSVRIAAAAAREVGEEFGFADKLQSMGLVVEEAAANVIEHAYARSEEAFYDISARLEKDFLVLRVEDQGMPMASFDLPVFDPSDPSGKGLGSHLMKAYCDQFSYVNLGRHGKAFDLMFRLPEGHLEAPEAFVPEAESAPEISEDQVKIRPFLDEDAAELVRCLYQIYRYSYQRDLFYIPEQLIRMNRTGEVQSMVAVLSDGSVVGHMALIRQSKHVSELGQAFVSPRVRGSSVFKRLRKAVRERCVELGLTGVCGDLTTAHIYTQKPAIEFGWSETALYLSVMESMQYKGIRERAIQREPTLALYKSLKTEPPRNLYAPKRHEAMIAEIYSRLGLNTVLNAGAESYTEEKCRLDFKVKEAAKSAQVSIHMPGADLKVKMTDLIRFFHDDQMEFILAEIPLRDPSVEAASRELEALGFFFSGVKPYGLNEGDSLCFQHLRVPELQKKDIVLYSDFARGLLDYIVRSAGGKLTLLES